MPETLCPIALRCGDTKKHPAPTTDGDVWRLTSRPDIAITQPSRQIRAEYLSMYTNHTLVIYRFDLAQIVKAVMGDELRSLPSGVIKLRDKCGRSVVGITSFTRSPDEHLECRPNFCLDGNAAHIFTTMRNVCSNAKKSAMAFDETFHSVLVIPRTMTTSAKVSRHHQVHALGTLAAQRKARSYATGPIDVEAI
jgi:hypothetical protein